MKIDTLKLDENLRLHDVEFLTAALLTIHQVETIFNNSISELLFENNATDKKDNLNLLGLNFVNLFNNKNLDLTQNVTNELNSTQNFNNIYLVTDDQIKPETTKLLLDKETLTSSAKSSALKENNHRRHKTKYKKSRTKYNLATTTPTLPIINAITPLEDLVYEKSYNKKSKNLNFKIHKQSKQLFLNNFEKENINENNVEKPNKNYFNNQLKAGELIFDSRYNFPESKYTHYNIGKYSEDDYAKENNKKYMMIKSKSSDSINLANENDGNDENVDPNNNLDLLLKYLKKPKLPKGTILWKVKNAPIPLVYFSITIIKGSLSRRGKPPLPNKRRARGVKIYLMGLNMPTGYTQITEVIFNNLINL